MSWGAVAVGVGGALIGGISANSAAKKQQEAAGDANAMQLQMFEQNRSDAEPWRIAGRAGLDQLLRGLGVSTIRDDGDIMAEARRRADEQLRPNFAVDPKNGRMINPDHFSAEVGKLSKTIADQIRAEQGNNQPGVNGYGDLMRDFSMQDFEKDPGYQFRLDQGEQAINRNALARGRYNSGSTLKALQGFNSDLASQEYSNAFNRFGQNQSNKYNRLAALSGVGQTTTQQVNADRSSLGGALGGNILGAGNAAAAGRVGVGNAISQGIGQGVNFWQSNQLLNSMRGGSGGSRVVGNNPDGTGIDAYGRQIF